MVASRGELIEIVFSDILDNYENLRWLSERAILAARSVDVNTVIRVVTVTSRTFIERRKEFTALISRAKPLVSRRSAAGTLVTVH